MRPSTSFGALLALAATVSSASPARAIAGASRAQTPLGTVHCLAEANSTGVRATLAAVGELDVAQNDLTLRAGGLPPQALGYALVSRQRDFVPLVGGGAGTLCLGPLFGRLSAQVVVASAMGAADVPLDLTQLPSPTGPFAVAHGETLLFQLWYRDAASGGGATSNLTDGLTVTFAPSPWFAGEQLFGGYTSSVQLVDVDGDSDVDLVTRTSSRFDLYYGDGTGSFQQGSMIANAPNASAARQVDVDGDCDIVWVDPQTYTPVIRLLENRLR